MTSVPDLLPLPSGLVAVTGEDDAAITRCLRQIGGDLSPAREQAPAADALWLDLALPGRDQEDAHQVWNAVQQVCPRWDSQLQQDLVEALDLLEHQDKKLFMLSTGSRRKVALVGLLASGATVTCLDRPFAALDAPSARVIREFLADMSNHPTRTWVVGDYEAEPRLPWRRSISLA